jgi:hypothetical protein
MTATPPASTVSYDVPTSLASLLVALGNPQLDPPALAPPSLPAAVVPAAATYGPGDHMARLLVRRVEDQSVELERMRV